MQLGYYQRGSNSMKGLRLTDLLIAMLLFTELSISSAQANFESNETSAVAACPSNHKMYYIGATPPTSTQNLSLIHI